MSNQTINTVNPTANPITNTYLQVDDDVFTFVPDPTEVLSESSTDSDLDNVVNNQPALPSLPCVTQLWCNDNRVKLDNSVINSTKEAKETIGQNQHSEETTIQKLTLNINGLVVTYETESSDSDEDSEDELPYPKEASRDYVSRLEQLIDEKQRLLTELTAKNNYRGASRAKRAIEKMQARIIIEQRHKVVVKRKLVRKP